MGSPPFTNWSDTDHSGVIIITTVQGLVYWLVPGVGQQVISFGQTGMFSWADYLYVESMVRLRSALVPRVSLNNLSDRGTRAVPRCSSRIFTWAWEVDESLGYRRSYGFFTCTSHDEDLACTTVSHILALPRKQCSLRACPWVREVLRNLLGYQPDST